MSADSMLGILTAIMGMAGFLVSIHPPTQRKWKIVAAGMFFALTSCAIVLVMKQSKESAATTSKLERSLETLRDGNAEIARVEALNTQLQQRLIDASGSIKALAARNVSLARQNIDTVTGGNSYCYIDVASPSLSGGLLIAIHRGRYPLYAVNARLMDLAKMKKFQESGQKLTIDNAFSLDLNIPISDLAVSTARPLQQIAFSSSERQSFNIFFSAHNGLWSEELRLRFIDGAWTRAIRMSRMQGNEEKVIWQKVDLKYPRVAGNVDWAE
jgi:hypothetical protein